MSKRKISKQQSQRIKQRQAAILQAAEFTEADLSEPRPGLLISCFGSQALVEDEQGQTWRCCLRQNLGTLVAGDKVVWRAGADQQGVVVAREPRESVLGRPNQCNELRVVAANIDQIVIVIAPEPQISETLLDSYLVVAETLQIPPLIVFNKVDLLSGSQQLIEVTSRYQSLGYRVLHISVVANHALDTVLASLQEHVSVVVGQSGVGKSSLIAKILPHESIAIGQLSTAQAVGKHTTSNSTLYHLPGGGALIDSPGIREFGLWNMEPAAIARGFIEFKPYLGKCKFSNCSHQHEPDCAILAAVQRDHISAQRFASYQQLIAQRL